MRLLITEDDRNLAAFLEQVLCEEGYAVERCENGNEAVKRVRSSEYQLLVLDWMIPGLDGVGVCREIRRCGLHLPILMLTARDLVRERVLGLESGADDYLVKPFDVEELLARIHALLRRMSGHGVQRVGGLEVDRVDRRVSLDGRVLELTAREFALLLHLVHKSERVVTRSEILTQVWPVQMDPESNVVEVHISRLREKFGSHAWMLETIRGRGYRLRAARAEH